MKSILRSCPWVTLLFAVIVFSLLLTVQAAAERVKLKGEIRGAKCTHFNVECNNNHIALEPDFVLVMPDGAYYFMPNLARAIKARHAYRKVLVHGELRQQELWVDRLVDIQDKKGSRAKTTWDWTARDEFWESR
jgi:hypothetical protein